jgi:glycosyltransferase involved in cell wall biosynthesis
MKILHLIYDHSHNPWVGGGGAVRVYEICKRLVRQGHEATIVSGNYPGAVNYTEDGLRFVFAGSSKNYELSTFSYALKAASLLKKQAQGFDIIVEDFAPWNPVFSAFLTKKPVVLHINHREGINILKRWWIAGLPFFLIERFYPLFFKYVTALSEETRKKIRIHAAPIVPAGIDEDFFKENSVLNSNGRVPSKSQTFGGANEAVPPLLYIGRLHIKNKGLDTLLTAMQGHDVKLLIAGRGKDEDCLKQMTKRLGLKNVALSGFVGENEKIHLLHNTQALVLPARFEGWGIVVLEAAACGKPVIVSDIPELRYAVDAGFGISFKTGDPNDLAQKIRFILENEPLRREMGQKAREYAKDYTWDKISLDYERFLQKVIGNRREAMGYTQ